MWETVCGVQEVVFRRGQSIEVCLFWPCIDVATMILFRFFFTISEIRHLLKAPRQDASPVLYAELQLFYTSGELGRYQ